MFHLLPSQVNFDNLHSDQTFETLYPPHKLHASAYPMKIRISSSTAKRRYIRKPAASLQCARVMDSMDKKPCNGQILVVDKVIASAEL